MFSLRSDSRNTNRSTMGRAGVTSALSTVNRTTPETLDGSSISSWEFPGLSSSCWRATSVPRQADWISIFCDFVDRSSKLIFSSFSNTPSPVERTMSPLVTAGKFGLLVTSSGAVTLREYFCPALGVNSNRPIPSRAVSTWATLLPRRSRISPAM